MLNMTLSWKSMGEQTLDSGIVVCGCHEAGRKTVRSLLEAGYPIRHMVTLDEAQAKRYEISGYFDYRPMASEFSIPVYLPRTYDLSSDSDRAFFSEHRFDLLVQGGWQRLFPAEVLESLRIGALGLHGSADLLPKGRGRSPLNWSLIEGRNRFILQMFLMDQGADDGDVIDKRDFDITPFDTIQTLYYKVAMAGRDMHMQMIPKLISGDFTRTPQRGNPSYYPKRTPEDGRIDWETMDVWEIYNFVRAQTRPYPGAFGELDGKTFKIWEAQPFDTRMTYPDAAYGSVVEKFDEAIIVNCRGGLLLVTDREEMPSS